MAITDLRYFQVGSFANVTNNSSTPPTLASSTLNASGDKYGFILQCPKAGTLHSFEFLTGAVANNPDNGVRLSFQDLTSGLPDGGVDQFRTITGTISANTWQVPPGPITSDGTDSGTKRTVAKGEWLACVVDFSSFVASDSFAVQYYFSAFTFDGSDNMSYSGDGNTGTYAKALGIPNMALKYDDGTYGVVEYWTVPSTAVNTHTYANNSTPDERALRFKMPFACRIWGVQMKLDSDNAVDIVLYDGSSSSLATGSASNSNRTHTAGATCIIPFTSSVELAANTLYRISVKPTTTSNISMYSHTVPNSSLLACYPGGVEFYGSTRTDAGSWSDSQTTRPMINPIFDGIDAGGGSVSGGSFTFVG